MNTILFVLSLLNTVVLVVGFFSLVKETVLTDFFEYYLERQGITICVMYTLVISLITLGSMLGAFGIAQVWVLFIYTVLSINMLILYAYSYYKGW